MFSVQSGGKVMGTCQPIGTGEDQLAWHCRMGRWNMECFFIFPLSLACHMNPPQNGCAFPSPYRNIMLLASDESSERTLFVLVGNGPSHGTK